MLHPSFRAGMPHHPQKPFLWLWVDHFRRLKLKCKITNSPSFQPFIASRSFKCWTEVFLTCPPFVGGGRGIVACQIRWGMVAWLFMLWGALELLRGRESWLAEGRAKPKSTFMKHAGKDNTLELEYSNHGLLFQRSSAFVMPI